MYKIFTILLPVLTLLTFSAASTQAQIPVSRIDDNAVRNAYQESCHLTVTLNMATCDLPAPPDGKRLAIRYLTADCQELHGFGPTKNQKISVWGRLPQNPFYFAASFIPRRFNSVDYALSEPVFMHSDVAPKAHVYKEGDGYLSCTVSVFGYLVTK